LTTRQLQVLSFKFQQADRQGRNTLSKSDMALKLTKSISHLQC